MKRLICLLLVFLIVLGFCACKKVPVDENVDIGNLERLVQEQPVPVTATTAAEMKLVKTVGEAHVSDDSHAEQPIWENMNLYSGYSVSTEPVSYAWIDLDETKLLKMDQQSQAGFEKDGRKLKVTLDSGSMFFCVLENLAEDEALEFVTSNATNMAMSIRGTTGIVEVVSDTESRVVLLEGSVTLENGNGSSMNIEAGKVASFTVDKNGEVVTNKRNATVSDVPDFALDLILENEDIKNKVLTTGKGENYVRQAENWMLYKDVFECYRAAFAQEKPTFGEQYWDELCEIYSYKESDVVSSDYWMTDHGFEAKDPTYLQNWVYGFSDINGDGYPELLVGDCWTAENSRFQACWTTDGQKVKSATPLVDEAKPFQQLAMAGAGYLVSYQSSFETYYMTEIRADVRYYPIDPSAEQLGLGACAINIPMEWNNQKTVVYDGAGQILFDAAKDGWVFDFQKENHLTEVGGRLQLPLN